MRRSRWVVLSLLLAFAVAGSAVAAKEKSKAGNDKPSAAPPGVTLNACGCYPKGDSCVCTSKKAKCECPGECEPAGCAEKRDKEAAKEYNDAVKSAQDAEKKREDEEKRKVQEAEKKRRDEQAAEEQRRYEREGESGETAAAEPAPSDEEKPAAKPTKKTAKKK
jgi:hypothetical protein